MSRTPFRCVAIAGLGALGNELFRLLGLLGAGEALLVDPDIVEASNLAKCTFFRAPGSVGRSKAEVLAEAGRAWFPATRWEPLAAELADVGWQRLQRCEVLFCGLDRDSARLEAARISTRLNLPVCDGGMDTSGAASGRVTWFPGREAACFGCRLTARRRRELLRTWSSAARPCHVPEEPGGWSVTPQLAAVTAALQVHFAAQWLERGEGGARSIEFRLDGPLRLEEIVLQASEACPFHAAPLSLVPVEGSFRSAIRPGEALGWEWPLCLRARCLDCGREFEPRLRVARLRRSGACPGCGRRRLLELDNRMQVDFEDPLAQQRPESLGLPPGHLYSIRKGRKKMEEPA